MSKTHVNDTRQPGKYVPSLLRSVLFWLLVTSGIALFWPIDRVGFDPFAPSPALLWSLIVATMFSLGTLVRRPELLPLRKRPWWVLLGVLAQVLVMPAAAWSVTKLVPMSSELAAGVILVGCVPGAMASNVLTHTAGGSVAFSVTLTSVATLLSPVTVPAVLSVVAGPSWTPSLDSPAVTSMRLLFGVVLPTVVGFVLSDRWLWIRGVSDRFASLVASVSLLAIIALVVAVNRERLASVSLVIVASLLLVNAVGYASGYTLGRLAGMTSRYRRALTLEVGMQNAGLGTTLAVSMYGVDSVATIPTAAYTFGCMLTGTVLAMLWHRFEPAELDLQS